MTDLIPLTFTVYEHPCDVYWDYPEQAIAVTYTSRWGGRDVKVEPTSIAGEYRVSGLFPRAFVEARKY